MNDAIISIHPRWAEMILSGRKTVEIRTRKLAISPNVRLWIYSTLPVGRLQLAAEVEAIISAEPETLWNRVSAKTGLTASEYKRYVNGTPCAYGIVLRNVSPLDPAPSLDTLRQIADDFSPPQFYRRIPRSHRLVRFLEDLLPHERASIVSLSEA